MISHSVINKVTDYFLSRIPRDEPIYDWARSQVFLDGAYSEKGWFNVDTSRYLIEPFNAVQSYDTHTVVVYKAVQTGGSLIGDISSLWWLTHKRTPVMYCSGRGDLASSHMETRLKHLIHRCPDLKPLLPQDPRLITNEGISELDYFVLGASTGNLQGRSVSFLIADETWMWTVPVDWAVSRVDDWKRVGNSKVLVISQPGQSNDQTDLLYKQGTMERWAVPCNSCSAYMIPDFHQMKWEKFVVGDQYDYKKIYDTIRYECPTCGHKHIDSPRLKADWNNRGKYIVTNPNAIPGVRSFHWSALHRRDWNGLVTDWLKANDEKDRGEYSFLINFVQQKLAQPETGVGGVEQQEFLSVATGSLEGEKLRIAAIDVQGKIDEMYYWLEIRAVSSDGRMQQLYFGKLDTEDDIKVKLLEFAVKPKLTFIDIAFEPDVVAGMIIRNGWFGMRGHATDGFPRVNAGKVTYKYFSKLRYHSVMVNGKMAKAPWMLWATDPIREVVGRLRRDKSGRFLSLDDDTYKKHLFAEQRLRELDRKTNRWKTTWYCKKGTGGQNHGFDTTCIITAACFATQQVGFSEDPNYVAKNPSSED
jgi:hypothetical protein